MSSLSSYKHSKRCSIIPSDGFNLHFPKDTGTDEVNAFQLFDKVSLLNLCCKVVWSFFTLCEDTLVSDMESTTLFSVVLIHLTLGIAGASTVKPDSGVCPFKSRVLGV